MGTARRQRNRARAKAVLGGKCVLCGATEDLEFDHKDWRTKLEGGGNDANRRYFGMAWATVLAGLDAYQLLCRSCHIEKSRQDRLERTGAPLRWEHWTSAGYHAHGCRLVCCDSARRLANAGLGGNLAGAKAALLADLTRLCDELAAALAGVT